MSEGTPDQKDVHLCVFVHGLWGNPAHLSFMSKSLKDIYPDLHILVPKTNSGNLTYDGIEVGGERVTQEVETELSEITAGGKKVTKISVIGYSLGGLIARYAIGLLYSRGVFERGIEPVNFVTFATPHLGVRSPVKGWKNELFNVFGSRTLSTSGTQLFGTDKFRDTGRPLLAVMADPDSIFVQGLKMFRKRSLYANIINDRTVSYYTAAMSQHDPFVNLDLINLHAVDGYEGVILDSDTPATPIAEAQTTFDNLSSGARSLVNSVPYALAWTVILPIGITAYLLNSGWQTYASEKRVREHEQHAGTFRQFPLLLERAVGSLGGGNALIGGDKDYLPDHDSVASLSTTETTTNGDATGNGAVVLREKTQPAVAAPADDSKAAWPTLALTPDQFSMISVLQPLFERYPVHISKATHSHAAIIRRLERAAFDEAFVVARHWTERFVV